MTSDALAMGIYLDGIFVEIVMMLKDKFNRVNINGNVASMVQRLQTKIFGNGGRSRFRS